MKNRLRKYSDLFTKGDWHSHTTYTDGKNSVAEMVTQARTNQLKVLAITEHVRRDLSYDWFALQAEVHALSSDQLLCLCGCEAKILNTQGDIDVSEKVRQACDVVIASVHRFSGTKEEYITSIKNMMRSRKADIWGHPLSDLPRRGFSISEEEWRSIIDVAKETDTIIEFNSRHKAPNERFRTIVKEKNCPYILSSDAHSTRDLRKND